MKYQVLTEELLKEVGEIIKENKLIKTRELVEYNEFEDYDVNGEEGGLLDGDVEPEEVVDFEEPEESTEFDMTEIDGLDVEEQVEYLLNKGYTEEDIINILAPDEVMGEGMEESEESEEITEGEEEITEGEEEPVEEPVDEACGEPMTEGEEEMEEAIGDTISDQEKEAVNYLVKSGLYDYDAIKGLDSKTIHTMYKTSQELAKLRKEDYVTPDVDSETIDLDDEEIEGFFPGTIEK